MSADRLVDRIPYLKIRAGPQDEAWPARLQEEFTALIQMATRNAKEGSEWCTIEAVDDACTRWKGTCWTMHEMNRYEYSFEFEIPVGYPTSVLEIRIPELEGKTPKMYRGGRICLDAHFRPLWSQHVPHYGIAHALVLGVCLIARSHLC